MVFISAGRFDIHWTLRSHGITRNFVYHNRAIKLLGETGGVIDRPITRRPQTSITLQVIIAVAARFHRNPMRKKLILSREESISQKFISRMVKEDSGLSA